MFSNRLIIWYINISLQKEGAHIQSCYHDKNRATEPKGKCYFGLLIVCVCMPRDQTAMWISFSYHSLPYSLDSLALNIDLPRFCFVLFLARLAALSSGDLPVSVHPTTPDHTTMEVTGA